MAEKGPAENTIEHADGILVERTGRTDLPPWDVLQREWNSFVGIAANTGRKIGFAAALFSDAYDLPPWEVRPKLANMPPRKKDAWKEMAADLFPGFVRTR